MTPRSSWLHKLLLLFGVCCAIPLSFAWGADRVRLVVDGAEHATHAQIARGIATHVAKPAGLEVDLRLSSGPASTLTRLREGSGQQFAILPADAADAYLGAATRGNLEAGQLMAPLRVIAPLHEEDIHFLVRNNSSLQYVHEIEGARINLGRLGSSTALSVSLIYRLLFGKPIPEPVASFHSHQDALVKLLEESVDVVAFVSPYPSRLLADMKPEARQYVRLLKFDASHSGTDRLFRIYSARVLPPASYPNLLASDVSVLVVRNYLVSHGRNDALQVRFASSWCQNLPALRSEISPALAELEVGLPPLVSGWLYSRPFEREINACQKGGHSSIEACSQEERILGLCLR